MSRYIPMPAFPDRMPVDISFVFEDEKPAGKRGFVKVDGEDQSRRNRRSRRLSRGREGRCVGRMPQPRPRHRASPRYGSTNETRRRVCVTAI